MRFSSDDGQFGVILTPAEDHDDRFFTFQLSIGGTLVGEADASIPWTAVQALVALPVFTDDRLDPRVRSASDIITFCLTDETLHDQTVSRLQAESLDRWIVVAYIFDGQAVWVAEQPGQAGLPVISTVPTDEYREIARAVSGYHASQIRRSSSPWRIARTCRRTRGSAE